MRTSATNPEAFIGWAGALADVSYWLDGTVDLAEAGVDMADIRLRFPEIPNP